MMHKHFGGLLNESQGIATIRNRVRCADCGYPMERKLCQKARIKEKREEKKKREVKKKTKLRHKDTKNIGKRRKPSAEKATEKQ